MKCVNCGADFSTADLKCPYCGTQNEIGEAWKKERNWYEKQYQKMLAELKAYGVPYVANRIMNKALVIMGIVFVILILIYAVPAIVSDVSLLAKRTLHKSTIEKEMKEYHQSGQWDELLKVVDEYDMYSSETYAYTQAAILQRHYQDYLMNKMAFLDMTEEEKQEDSYYLEYAIRDSRDVYWVDCGIYSDLDPQNVKQHKLFQEEIVTFWEVTLGLTEDEIRYFTEEDYISYDEMDALILKIKERKAWQ